jgi:hypothetical protein
MGETPKHELVVTVHLADIDALVSVAALAIGRAAATPPPADPLPTMTPYDLGLEPWTFVDPQQKCEVVTYLDDRNQLRHVPTTRASEVPGKWRRVWIEGT